jgi:hypothetical protein
MTPILICMVFMYVYMREFPIASNKKKGKRKIDICGQRLQCEKNRLQYRYIELNTREDKNRLLCYTFHLNTGGGGPG